MNYGTLLAEMTGGILISYKEYGSYQGDYVAILEKNNEWYIYKGSYGSCSGCDWLHGAGEDVETDAGEYTKVISQKEKEAYLKGYQPFLVIPKDQIPDTVEDLDCLLPANTRTNLDIAGYNDDVDPLAVLLEQIKHPEFNNLKYLEDKYDQKNKSKEII